MAEREDLIEKAQRRYAEYDRMWNAAPPGQRESVTKMAIAATACADLVPLLLAEILKPGTYRQAITDLRDQPAWDEWFMALEDHRYYDEDNLLAADFLASRLSEGSTDG